MFISQGDDVGLGATGPLMLGGDAWAAFASMLSLLESHTGLPTIVNIIITLFITIFCISVPSVFYLRWRESKSYNVVGSIELPTVIKTEIKNVCPVIINDDKSPIENDKIDNDYKKENIIISGSPIRKPANVISIPGELVNQNNIIINTNTNNNEQHIFHKNK